ncbi:MAG: hypothetical protein N2C13_06470 [Chloroflexota bacterium]
MAISPDSPFARIESNIWSSLIAVIDSSQLVRKMTPFVYLSYQRARRMLWVFTVMALASSGLMIGFVAGLLAAKLSS